MQVLILVVYLHQITTTYMKNLAIHIAINSKATMLKEIGLIPASLIKLNSVRIRQSKDK